MSHFKRKKCRRHVPCTLCTQYRWMGNSQKAKGVGRHKAKEYAAVRAARREESDEPCGMNENG